MKAIYKPCSYCDGKGYVPVLSTCETTAVRRGQKLYDTTCSHCNGTGASEEILGYFNE